jgi:hypothetical protein
MTAAVLASSVAACKGRDKNVSSAFGETAHIDTTLGHAPEGVRIKVEVLNASRIHGAARTATFLLRSRGYDVVAISNAGTVQPNTTVLDRSDHPRWAELIAKAVGGKALSKPDTSRYLDATVILGTSWTPPPMPFHP